MMEETISPEAKNAALDAVDKRLIAAFERAEVVLRTSFKVRVSLHLAEDPTLLVYDKAIWAKEQGGDGQERWGIYLRTPRGLILPVRMGSMTIKIAAAKAIPALWQAAAEAASAQVKATVVAVQELENFMDELEERV